MSYDDDRPGMMRVHIGQIRGRALAQHYTLDGLRTLARLYLVPTGYSRKIDLAEALAFAGAVPPGYDRGAEL